MAKRDYYDVLGVSKSASYETRVKALKMGSNIIEYVFKGLD